MLRCLKWFPFAFVAVFAAFCAIGWAISSYPVQVTLRAYNTKGQEIPVIINNPESKLDLAGGDWRLTKPVGYKHQSGGLSVTVRPKDAIYGPPREVKVQWMTNNEYQNWLDKSLKDEMKSKGADANAYEAVRKALESRHAPGTHNYDYAIIFAPVKAR